MAWAVAGGMERAAVRTILKRSWQDWVTSPQLGVKGKDSRVTDHSQILSWGPDVCWGCLGPEFRDTPRGSTWKTQVCGRAWGYKQRFRNCYDEGGKIPPTPGKWGERRVEGWRAGPWGPPWFKKPTGDQEPKGAGRQSGRQELSIGTATS